MQRSTTDAPINPLPPRTTTLHDRDTYIIRRTWFTPLVFFFVFFALFWNGFMVVWMTTAIMKGIWVMAAFGSIHMFVGLGIIYYCIATFLNKTDVAINPSYLSVRHHPLPWFGAKQIRVHEIEQLYTKRHITHTKNGGTNITYRVHVITSGNRDQKLISGLADPGQALYFEKEIESILGIQDRQVIGEMRD